MGLLSMHMSREDHTNLLVCPWEGGGGGGGTKPACLVQLQLLYNQHCCILFGMDFVAS